MKRESLSWRAFLTFSGVTVAQAQQTLVQIPADLPALSGQHQVWRISYDWTDSSRSEILSKDPNQRRELMVHLWYPTDSTSGAERAPYYPFLVENKTGNGG
jgi:hypothetical protein